LTDIQLLACKKARYVYLLWCAPFCKKIKSLNYSSLPATLYLCKSIFQRFVFSVEGA